VAAGRSAWRPGREPPVAAAAPSAYSAHPKVSAIEDRFGQTGEIGQDQSFPACPDNRRAAEIPVRNEPICVNFLDIPVFLRELQ
jgi:hypothetical protein